MRLFLSSDMRGFIYIIVNFEAVGKGKTPCIRIGKTKTPGYSRPKTQCSYLPFKADYFGFEVEDYTEVETEIHRALRPFKTNGDWYAVQPEKVIASITAHFDCISMDFPSPRSMWDKVLTKTANE